MARQALNLGTVADDGTGDTIRAGGTKLNAMTTELYAPITYHRSGAKYAIAETGQMAAGNTTYGSGVLRFIAWRVVEQITVASLIAWVGTTSGNAQLAIYAADPTSKLPAGAPVASTASTATAASGTEQEFPITGGTLWNGTTGAVLPPGLYYAAIWQDNGTAVFSVVSNATLSNNSRFIGGKTAMFGSATACNINVVYAATYASGLPTITAPTETGSGTGGSNVVAVVASGINGVPMLGYEVA